MTLLVFDDYWKALNAQGEMGHLPDLMQQWVMFEEISSEEAVALFRKEVNALLADQ